MKISLRTRTTSSLFLPLFAALLLSFPASAQQDESADEDEGWGQLIVEYGAWIAEPGGASNDPASIVDLTNAFNQTVIGFSNGTKTEDYARFGAELAGNRGRVLITWYAHDDNATLSGRDPGNFIFGQLLSYPAFAGLSNDGRADAFSAHNTTALRDLKIEYSRIAFSNSRVVGRWTIGYRKVEHRADTDAIYYALVPTFPAFVPPLVGALPNLTPLPETAELSSNFLGVGLTGGMEFEAPLWRDKFSLEGTIGLSVLQGDVDTSYRATNHYYSLGGEVLDPPYSEFGDFFVNSSGVVVATASAVSQETLDVGLRSESLSRAAQVLEVSLGARWNALRFMDVYAGFRSIHYGNVGVDLRPRSVVVIGNVINTTDASETARSVTYQGFYAGVGFQF